MTNVFKSNSSLEENDDENGAYKQQLKNALHGGFLEGIRQWVSKHYIGMSGGTLQEYINHALHAEKVTTDKKREKTRDVMYGEGQESEIYYQGTFHDLSTNPETW